MALGAEDGFKYPPDHRFGRRESDRPFHQHSAGHLPARPKGIEDSAAHVLQGLHNHSGNWVSLARFETEDAAKAALRKCNGSEQPDLTQVVVKWEHFSAYKVSKIVTVNWMRDPLS